MADAQRSNRDESSSTNETRGIAFVPFGSLGSGTIRGY